MSMGRFEMWSAFFGTAPTNAIVCILIFLVACAPACQSTTAEASVIQDEDYTEIHNLLKSSIDTVDEVESRLDSIVETLQPALDAGT